MSSVLRPAAWAGHRVAVTGHTGFKGSWLSLWLAEAGAEVYGYALAAPAGKNAFEALRPDVRTTLGDVRDAAAFRTWLHDVQPHVLFHLAAQPLVRRSYADPSETFETNVTGTMNVLEAARAESAVRAIVIVTSDKAYAPAAGLPRRESDALGGDDPYSASKACAELVAQAYARSFFEDGAVVVTVRAGNVIGGGDWSDNRLIPDIVRAAACGAVPVLRYPDAIRPWQHVLDPLGGYIALAERAAGGDRTVAGAWNFGPGPESEIAVKEVVQRALAALGVEPRWRHEATPIAELPELRIDATKARTRLGWSPRYDIAAALCETMAWYAADAGGGDMAAFSRAQLHGYLRSQPQVVA